MELVKSCRSLMITCTAGVAASALYMVKIGFIMLTLGISHLCYSWLYYNLYNVCIYHSDSIQIICGLDNIIYSKLVNNYVVHLSAFIALCLFSCQRWLPL